MPSQKAFVLAREIGYRVLGLTERPATSTWIKVESFEQVLNNFKASYFAGALLIDRDLLREDLGRFFARAKWDGKALLEGMRRYDATPETFFYRLTQLIPRFFGLREIFFMRFSQGARSGDLELTKVFNLSRVPVPHGVGSDETYCRRWPALKLLKEMARPGKRRGSNAVVTARRSYFLDRVFRHRDGPAARALRQEELQRVARIPDGRFLPRARPFLGRPRRFPPRREPDLRAVPARSPAMPGPGRAAGPP